METAKEILFACMDHLESVRPQLLNQLLNL